MKVALRAERTMTLRLPPTTMVRDALREDGNGFEPLTLRVVLIRPSDEASDGNGSGNGNGNGGEVGLVGSVASLRGELFDAFNSVSPHPLWL